jgi:hypothetical protein
MLAINEKHIAVSLGDNNLLEQLHMRLQEIRQHLYDDNRLMVRPGDKVNVLMTISAIGCIPVSIEPRDFSCINDGVPIDVEFVADQMVLTEFIICSPPSSIAIESNATKQG